MSGRVVVVASGHTERLALPHLVDHLKNQGTVVCEVRIPSQHAKLDVGTAETIIKAAWYRSMPKPDKFVVLVDTDGADPRSATEPLREELSRRLRNLDALVLVCYAQWHLESWYFGDAKMLREHLGRDLGSVDPTRPDRIENPKQHLKNLLGDRLYTAAVSKEIARILDAETIAARSPSFRGFIEAVENGGVRISDHSRAE